MLPNSGTFSYNGVTWAALYKSKIAVKPVKDSAGRALVAREYTLEAEGYVSAPAGSTTDANMAALRRQLEAPAGALVYKNKGYGDLIVNAKGGPLRDMAYGPWPDVLEWQPIGNDQGAFVRWRCTTQVPCEDNPTAKGIVEYCWSESWDIDPDGYTKRSIEGHLTVQATRVTPDSRAIPDSADAYRDKVVPTLPPGFRRATQHYKLSEDKRTLEFQFADEEMPQPLPDGVSTAEVHHKVTWRRPHKGSLAASSSISGTITLPAHAPKSDVWNVILLILRSRWPLLGPPTPAAKAAAPGGGGGGGFLGFLAGAAASVLPLAFTGPPKPAAPAAGVMGGPKKLTWLLDSIEIDDDMFGRATSFHATAVVLGGGAFGPRAVMGASGLWTPIPGTSWQKWRASIFAVAGAGKPMAPRGMAGMSFQNRDDAIVDLCGRAAVLPSDKSGVIGKGLLNPKFSNRQPNGQTIDPDSSYLNYRLRIRLREHDRIAVHKPLVQRTPPRPVKPLTGFFTQTLGQLPSDESGPDTTDQGQGAGVTSSTADLIQRVGAPDYRVVLEGQAVRVAYPIATPRLQSVGGVPLTQLEQDVDQEQIGSIGGLPIYAGRWRVEYIMPDAPKGVLPMPVNPAVQ